MESKFIMPFIHSIENVMGTMLKTKVTFAAPYIKQEDISTRDVSGIISFTGSVTGSVVVRFPMDVAKTLIGRFIGAEVEEDDPDFIDAIGELVNMISGGAKASLQREKAMISCPTVVMGRDYHVHQGKDKPIIIIPCECNAGTFLTEVGLKSVAPSNVTESTAATA